MYTPLNDYDITLETLNRVVSKIKSLKLAASKKTCFLGFDGYIDSLYSLVKKRKDGKNWVKMDTMKEFSKLIADISGSSANIERVLKKKIFGGFAPNTSRALNSLGAKVYLMAALGYPEFSKYYTQSLGVKSISIANPGETLGLEFNDGKIMITDFEPILEISWNSLKEIVSTKKLIDIINNSSILGFGHWALIPNINSIWKHMLAEIFPSLGEKNKKLFFVDIADITKRSKKDILEMINILQKVDHEMPVMLSVNDREAIRLSTLLTNTNPIRNKNDFIEGGRSINKEIDLSFFVIHSPHFATISTQREHYWVTEGYTSMPNYTVAAGDHFHSGVALGLSCKLTPPEAILMGNALTAIFVRTGLSPNFDQLSNFINRYLEFILDDIPHFP